MKALVLEDYKKFVFADLPVPEPGAEEVLVAVKACGICGSDVHGMDGSTGRRRPPIVMGHEASGIIAQVGGAVTGWSAGDRVTFDSTIYCGHCEYCRRGEINLCDRRRVLGVSCEGYRQHGAFAEFVAVPQRILYRLPEGLSFEHAALVEPFAIAVHALRRAPVSLNDSVVVAGAGMIGLALVQVLRAAGGGRLIVMDVADARLALAKEFGASDVVNSSTGEAYKKILDLTRGRGVDAAFEAVGVSATVELAVRCLRKGGTLTLVGNLAQNIEFPLQAVVTRELSIHASCASRGEYPAVLDLLSRGTLKPDALISAVAPLAEGAAWFDRLYRRETGLMKVLLKP
jgi:2-desacetyl-2-hydroxyethyl bacteriochlorophyllide A dehydrogenase